MTDTLPEPAAWLHIQGAYSEAASRPLDDDEKARGWTEKPLFTAEQAIAVRDAAVAEAHERCADAVRAEADRRTGAARAALLNMSDVLRRA